jgi:RNA polymerase sigma-70 factor (ECF subfamily)
MDPQLNVSKLLSRITGSERYSFGEFYESHLNEIYRYILFRVHDHDEAEDLTAKVFLEAWESLVDVHRGQKIQNIRAWVYRVAHNKVIDYYRTRKVHESIDDIADTKLPGGWLESKTDDLFASRKLADGVRRLPPNYQEVIILRFINEMSHAEVAEIMNLTESHVRVLQYRALKRMRELMSEVRDE